MKGNLTVTCNEEETSPKWSTVFIKQFSGQENIFLKRPFLSFSWLPACYEIIVFVTVRFVS